MQAVSSIAQKYKNDIAYHHKVRYLADDFSAFSPKRISSYFSISSDKVILNLTIFLCPFLAEAKCSPLNPCLNGGRCQEMPFSYMCICKNGFAGRNCESMFILLILSYKTRIGCGLSKIVSTN